MIHQITDIRYQITKNRLNKRFFNREISLIHIYYSTFLPFCQGGHSPLERGIFANFRQIWYNISIN